MNDWKEKIALPRSVLDQPPEQAAKELLGCLIQTKQRIGDELVYTAGIITETEAYLSEGDLAAHNSRGKTKANRSLFDTSGTLYIHPMRAHLLMDLVTEDTNLPGSVLLRAFKPVTGIEVMMERRGVGDITKLATGPGNLCKSLGVVRKWDGMNIFNKDCPVEIFQPSKISGVEIDVGKRIGISKNQSAPLRFRLLKSLD